MRQILMASFLLFFALTGCSAESAEDKPPVGHNTSDSHGDDSSSAEDGTHVTDAGETSSENTAATEDNRYAASEIPPPRALGDTFKVVDQLLFPFQEEDQSCKGFDLDDEVTIDKEKDECGWDDFTHPNGKEGIDNNLARLTPLFDSVGLGQAFQYLQDSIESSGFFLMWEIRGVDDLENDDTIELIFHVGGGAGILGTDGSLVPDQTLCIQNDSPRTKALSARLEDGWVHAQFDSLTMPLVLFERLYEFVFIGARLEARLHPDGTITDGIIGGVLTLDNLLQIAEKGGQNQGGLYETVQFILGPMGDMPTDEGPCTGLSSAFEFTSLPAFIYPEEMECDTCGNGACEYFESCETCLEDCCPDCGDGVCNFYPQETFSISFSSAGFSPETTEVLVGDTLQFTNETDNAIHLLCDNLFDVVEIAPGASHNTVTLESGTSSCRTLEETGLFANIIIQDNFSETCQSCPSDCPDGC